MVYIINNKEKKTMEQIKCPKCDNVANNSTFIVYDGGKKEKKLICNKCGNVLNILFNGGERK